MKNTVYLIPANTDEATKAAIDILKAANLKNTYIGIGCEGPYCIWSGTDNSGQTYDIVVTMHYSGPEAINDPYKAATQASEILQAAALAA